MQRLAVFAALLAGGYGFAAGGVLGALTGLVAAFGIGSGLAIARAEAGTDVASEGATRHAQRIGGILAAIGCLIGAYYGGWRFGWAWAIAGYAGGVAVSFLLRFLMGRPGQFSPRRAGEPVPITAIPSRFDLDNEVHVTMIDDIRETYSALLADDSHPYAQSMYRPASLLPYPREAIRNALEALLDFIEARRESCYLDTSIRTPEAADTVRTCLALLDNFLEVPSAMLPTDRMENAKAGVRLKHSR